MRSLPSFRTIGAATLAAALAPALVAAQAATKPAAQAAKPAASAAADPVVISAGNEHLRASQFDALLKGAPPENQAAMMANKRAVADQIGKMLALVAEARRRGLDQDPTFQTQMMLARDNALAKSVVDKIQAEVKPTDAQVQSYYAAHTSDFGQTKVKHILIGDNETPGGESNRTQQQALALANDVEAKLKAGGDFAALAKANSDDPGSKDKGGELGNISPGETVPEFEAAVKDLPVGQVSAPVHTRFGYHIIEVESRTTMPLAEAKSAIEQQLTDDAVTAAIDKIAAAEHVTLNDSYFGPAKPPVKPDTSH